MTPAAGDAELIARVRAGSAEALGTLYARHADRVMALAYRLTGSRADAEDVVHDVFLGLPEALARYEERGSFAGWLGRLGARTALMRLRAGGRRREVSLESARDSVHRGGEDAAEAQARGAALAGALAALPESLRVVFVLKVIEGYSHAEVAGMLGITAGASEVRLVRAVKALRRQLGAET